MTDAEMRVVAGIVLRAHGGCHVCGREMLQVLGNKFPEHRNALVDAWLAEYDSEDLDGPEWKLEVP